MENKTINKKVKVKFKNCITGEIEEAEVFKENYDWLLENHINEEGYVLYNPDNIPKTVDDLLSKFNLDNEIKT